MAWAYFTIVHAFNISSFEIKVNFNITKPLGIFCSMSFTLSCCFIVKNEEKVLSRILDCVKKFAEEIIVVDTGSSDKTKDIAKKYTDKVFDFEWCDDFSKARNYAFSKSTCDYNMWLDADDFIFPKDIEKILKLKQDAPYFDMAYLNYVTGFDEKYRPTFVFERERILKNDGSFKWVEPVHEVIVPHGVCLHEKINIYHFKSDTPRGDRNLKIYERRLSVGERLSPRAMFYYARELYYNAYYEKAINVFLEFLDRDDAWVENKIEACLNLSHCFLKLNDKNNAKESLLKSFLYDLPRAEILSQLGNIFLGERDYEKAEYYYLLALKCKLNVSKGGFVLPDYYDFIPSINLCVIYYNKGNIDKAIKYHKRAKRLKPNNASVKYNEKIFDIKT